MPLDRGGFREALLALMERKDHWAWPRFTSGQVRKELLHVHLEQEYASYVRDFPILVARAYVACPIAAVRRELVANVYEEETGGLAAGRPHPELFLEVPRGLGMDVARFDDVALLPATAAYRACLDELTTAHGWEVAAAVSVLFLEGTRYERGELDATAPRRPEPPLEAHPLVVHYGLAVEHLALTKAHRKVEGQHRAAAWRVLLDHIAPERFEAVLAAMERTLAAWLAYRDGVAEACGLRR